MRNLKKLLANKNVVTLLGAIVLALVVYGLYKWQVNKTITLITIPCANQAIPARTEIKEEMIGKCEVTQATLKGNVITNSNALLDDMYTNVNTVVPAGSFFFKDVIVSKKQLPDSFLIDIPEGYIAYPFSVNVKSTYGNSVYPGNYVDIYFKGVENSKIIFGKLIENVKVLAVKDAAGNHVFEGAAENRQPAQIIFAVTDEMHKVLRSAEYISGVEIILVPTNLAYTYTEGDEIVTTITSDYIKSYIEERSIDVD